MTYNGVGLTTPRGSGTSGFIQRNAGQLAQGGGRTALMWNTRSYYKPDVIRQEKGKDIKEHELKRAIELKLLVQREDMEEEGKLTEEQIEDELIRLRREYTNEQQEQQAVEDAMPKKSLADFKEAFSVPSAYEEGQAFDRELQENIKQERIAKRREKEEADERLKLEAEIAEEERKLVAKKAEKEAKKRRKKEEKKAKKDAKKKKKKEKKHAKDVKKDAANLVDDVLKKEEITKEKESPKKRKRRDTSETPQKRKRRYSVSSSRSSSSSYSSSSSPDSRPRKRRR
eukprot:TRINITY_DN7414_c0_g3_i1.p1 TRINITY_DN7414_c0_g3~~TRINITY_DN7414_c0_g3_i1.p1  ORF type:complete len:285 (+),score=103.14 TRINITY_DN7414_c0_g3_i1:72-926(+)